MEQWKPIKSYEDLYEISSLGRVRRKESVVCMPTKYGTTTVRHVKASFLSQKKKKNGYMSVQLCKDGQAKDILVHRLVAEAFLDPDSERPYVNHKNLHKEDNRVDNLEWCTPKENTAHQREKGAQSPSSLRKQIRCVETGMVFASSYQAAMWLNETYYGNKKNVPTMARTLRGATKKKGQSYGYHWKDVIEPSTTSA